MKRCPQCDFIYNDTDEVCDLDGTPLLPASDFDQQGPQKKSKRRRVVLTTLSAIAVATLLLIGSFVFLRSRPQPQIPARTEQLKPVVTPALTSLPSPSPAQSALPEVSRSDSKAHTANDASTRAAMSRSPVGTSTSQVMKANHVLIHMSNGARIEADEVWRTKEGVWYRRSGMVTLVKANRVKSIERAKP